MAAVPCEKCGNKMSAEAAVCPHCGARRTGVEKAKLSGEELVALAHVSTPAGYQAPRGLWKTLLWPGDEITGGRRTIDLALTLACLPLVLAGFATIGFMRLFAKGTEPGEYAAAFLMSIVGGISLLLLGGFAVLPIVGGEVALLWVRAWMRHTSTRSYKLTALK